MQTQLPEPDTSLSKEQKRDVRNYIHYIMMGVEPLTLDEIEKIIESRIYQHEIDNHKEKVQAEKVK